jgi:hypothetical protein
MSAGASAHGSSSELPSYEMCSRLASMEKGGSPRLEAGTSIPLASAYAIRRVRDWRSHSRQGATTLMSGLSA